MDYDVKNIILNELYFSTQYKSRRKYCSKKNKDGIYKKEAFNFLIQSILVEKQKLRFVVYYHSYYVDKNRELCWCINTTITVTGRGEH